MMRARSDKQTGFTIVELLIVVVVIAILAAITIVAYNGITQRTKDAAVRTTSSQAAKKIALFGVNNADAYPDTLDTLATAVGLPAPAPGATLLTATDGTSYQYSVNNASNPRTYCVTVTKENISYTSSSSNIAPIKGACAGHGVNGVSPIQNLVTNPRPDSSFWFSSSSSVAPLTFVGSGVNSAARSTRAATGTYGLYASRTNPTAIAQPGDVYTILFTISASVPTNVTAQIGYGTGSSSLTALNQPVAVTVAPQTIRYTVTIPSGGSDGLGIFSKFLWTEGVPGDYFEVSKVMWVKGEYSGAYADGGTAGWAWNAGANTSISSGPPQ